MHVFCLHATWCFLFDKSYFSSDVIEILSFGTFLHVKAHIIMIGNRLKEFTPRNEFHIFLHPVSGRYFSELFIYS